MPEENTISETFTEEAMLSKTHLEILTQIAMDGSFSKYNLQKILNKSYSSIYNIVDDLQNLKLIEIVKTRKSERNWNIDVDYYDVTFNGVFYILAASKNPETINSIIHNYQHLLPMFFGKWSFFQNQGLGDWAHYMLKNLTKNPFFSIQKLATTRSIEKFRQLIEDHVKDVIFSVEFYSPNSAEAKEQDKRLTKLREDPELDRLIGSLLEEEVNDAVKYAQDGKWWKARYFEGE